MKRNTYRLMMMMNNMEENCPQCGKLGLYRANGLYLCDNRKCKQEIFSDEEDD